MSNSEIKSRFHILHIEVSHGEIRLLKMLKIESYFFVYLGADRYDIHLHFERAPLVRDLMEEVEKKSRVTLMNQQLIFRGKVCSFFFVDEKMSNFSLFISRSTFTSNTE